MNTNAGLRTIRSVSRISSHAIIASKPKNTTAPSSDEGIGPASKASTFVGIGVAAATIPVEPSTPI